MSWVGCCKRESLDDKLRRKLKEGTMSPEDHREAVRLLDAKNDLIKVKNRYTKPSTHKWYVMDYNRRFTYSPDPGVEAVGIDLADDLMTEMVDLYIDVLNKRLREYNVDTTPPLAAEPPGHNAAEVRDLLVRALAKLG